MKKFFVVLALLSVVVLTGCATSKQQPIQTETSSIQESLGGKSRSLIEVEQPIETQISPDTAKEKAFAYAKINPKDAYKVEVEFDVDEGVPYYEVSFKHGKRNYEYDIHANTGLLRTKETIAGQASQGIVPVQITSDNAKEIALTHAGVQEDSISGLKVELEHDGDTTLYEVEFHSGRYEYDYKIHATTGAILVFERNR